jgi:protein-S-isoprenylcysteine O-methyltransferase Ste14
MRIPVPWVFVMAYLAGLMLESAFPRTDGAASTPGLRIVGGVVLAVGTAIAMWGLVTFRRAGTTTIPGRTSSALVTWGPYRFTRNPMYVGLSVAYLGEAGLLGHAWPVAVLPLVIAYLNWVVIPVEEARLREVFPEDYERYRARVHRWL